MATNYEKIIYDNLVEVYDDLPRDLGKALPAVKNGERFTFKAFGEKCSLGPDEITLSGRPEKGPKGLLISLYAAYANREPMRLEPLKSFRDLPGSMPYQGAFSANAEQALVPHVPFIKGSQERILAPFDGEESPMGVGGDFSFVLYPLPKIALCYIYYLPDEEFPASVTCLFSANALSFMPLDGLADVAEYTSKGIICLLGSGNSKQNAPSYFRVTRVPEIS